MPLDSAVSLSWRTARGTVRLERPAIVAILNVTPDSFWDGGLHAGVETAVRHVALVLEQGADILDVGGESTRPGAAPVSTDEELARVIPVVKEVTRRWPHVPVSVDTVKAEVARAALEAGAAIINDVSGLRLDPQLGAVIAAAGAGVILMHSRGGVDRMARYELAVYGDDPVGEIVAELGSALDTAQACGIERDAVVLDPGLGFAKRTEQSLLVLAQLDRFATLNCPVLVGPSRKRFIGEAGATVLRGPEPTPQPLPVEDRLEGTLAACVIALFAGARLFRVHDVAAARRALDFAHAVRLIRDDR